MKERAYFSRRKFVAAASGIISGLSGCSGTSTDQDTTHTSTTKKITTASNTTMDEPTEDTETPSRWELNPVEHDRLVGAYYYTWYIDAYPMRDWTPAKPSLGFYNSKNEDVINQHIKWAREHGINWFAISWAEDGSWNHGTFVEDYFLPAELGDQIQFSLLYESNVQLEFSNEDRMAFNIEANREQLRNDFQHFENNYFNEPNYLTIDGRPVLTFYSAHGFAGPVKEAFAEATDAIDADPYLIAEVIDANNRTGPVHNVEMEWLEAFDAVTGYNIYEKDSVSAVDGDFTKYTDRAEKDLNEWALTAAHADLPLVPNLIPGYNETQISDRKREYPILERDPDGFRELANLTQQRMDPELDAVVVTSFNEWPEYTAVEPAESYGTTYLEIIEDELTSGQIDYFRPQQYPLLQLQFDPVLSPPKEDLPLQFGMQLATLELHDANGETIHGFDIGTPEKEPYMLEGSYPPNPPRGSKGRTRWLGGPTAQTTIGFEPKFGAAISATLQGTAPEFSEQPIDVDVVFDGQQTDQIAIGPGLDSYSISLQNE